MSASALIEFDNVSRWYGEVIGVNRVSVTLRPGITGLLGPNGAGKSTMMNLMSGLIAPSEGSVTVFGESVFGNFRQYHRLGFCPQADSFYETMTGQEFLESLLKLRGWMTSRAHSAALHALEQLGMAVHRNRRIQSYSKGMRQRIKVALAIAHNPDIIILDEPLDGLDAVGRREMIELIRRFGREGRNVIISSHVLHEIEEMTNNVLMMGGGYLLAEGAVREVRDALSSHPHRVLIRCAAPRQAAVFFLEQSHTLSAKVEESDSAVVIQTRDIRAFFRNLDEYVVDRHGDVSLFTVLDEDIGSIFDYVARAGGRGRGD